MSKFVRELVSISIMLLLLCFSGDLHGQTKKGASTAEPAEAGESLGVGLESRFDSGTTAVKVDRVNITPGSPMNVKPTMDTMVGGDEKSFGGILSRYDTSKFGKFFATGSLAARAATARRTNLQMEDGRVDNSRADASRLYPPRLVLNEKDFPVSSSQSAHVRLNVSQQFKNLEKRLGLSSGQVELVFSSDSLILQGRIHSRDQANTLINVLALEPGIDRIEDRLTVMEEKSDSSTLTFPGRE